MITPPKPTPIKLEGSNLNLVHTLICKICEEKFSMDISTPFLFPICDDCLKSFKGNSISS